MAAKSTKKGSIYRKLKLQYLKLLRMKSAPSIIARGYAIGTFLEFLTLPTLGVAFFLLYPFSKIFRASFASSMIGYIVGKFIMLFFLYWNYSVGNMITKMKVSEQVSAEVSHFFTIDAIKENGIAFFIGSAVNGTIVGLVSYFLVYYLLVYYRWKKSKKRKVKLNHS
ncbi:DUF2062 domain-containing protein [Tepidibacillus fermentans]|uniref:DUF2062 domain-containing protein n=1 Tax=Tepidibacillus fermentans TaxID=1281767 RepID=A0A4R3KL35_9BACI|nr:DUF2062 domain-containing protein [Tepidibacillus fermentans]TCS84447.1 hypothetical protein EDD72_101111 [Tepidibacillus fermentans]